MSQEPILCSVSEIKTIPWGIVTAANGKGIACTPSTEDVCRAIRDRDFDTRPYSDNAQVLAKEWAESGDLNQECRQCRDYHASRIAWLVENWNDDPISVTKRTDGTLWIDDGGHRLAAARFKGLKEIRAIIKTPE